MNIVHCIFSFNTGGSEAMLCDIISIQSRQHNVSLIIINDSYDNKLLANLPQNVNVILLNRVPGSRSPWFIAKFNWQLFRLSPDIIHIHSYELARIIFNSKNKVWFTVHSLDMPMTYSHRVHGIIAISQAVKDDIKPRSQCPNISVIPNGINTELIKDKQVYNNSQLLNFKIIQVARLDYSIKGQDLLIKALALLKAKGVENVFVDFIGNGPDGDYLKQLSSDLGVAKNIRFLGLKDRKYIYEHLCDYDLMCHPARYEGFGLVVAEAMAAGLPVLVTDEGGPYEIIRQGEFGASFRKSDAGDLADMILESLNNYLSLTQKAPEARSHIEHTYSINRMVDKYLQAYNNQL